MLQRSTHDDGSDDYDDPRQRGCCSSNPSLHHPLLGGPGGLRLEAAIEAVVHETDGARCRETHCTSHLLYEHVAVRDWKPRSKQSSTKLMGTAAEKLSAGLICCTST